MEAERIRRDFSRDMSRRYRLFRAVMLAFGRLVLGFTIHGAEKVPREGALIVAANHRRYADPVFVCMAVPRRIQWMAKKELFVSLFDRFFYFIGAFPVDRKKGARAALRTGLDLLAAGRALGIFPEGTRRKGYDPEDAPKSGAAMLASRASAPPEERLRGGRLHVYVGDPIKLDDMTRQRQDRREAADRILRGIYELKKDEKSRSKHWDKPWGARS